MGVIDPARAGMKPIPHSVNLDLAGLFKHPLRGCLKSPDSVIFHRLCFPIPASKQLGANPGPRNVSLDLPGLFKHPLRSIILSCSGLSIGSGTPTGSAANTNRQNTPSQALAGSRGTPK